MKFRVRIDDVSADTEKLLREHVADVGVSHVLVRHYFLDGHNPHYHYFIDIPDMKSQQAYRYRVKTRIAFHLNMKSTDYSVVQCDDNRVDEYIQYLFNTKKGNKWSLISSTIDTTDHQRRAQDVADAFDEASKLTKDNVSQWTIALELRNAIEKLDGKMYEHQLEIVDLAIEIHNKYRKPFCEFSLRKVIMTAIGQSKWRQEMVEKVTQKLFW